MLDFCESLGNVYNRCSEFRVYAERRAKSCRKYRFVMVDGQPFINLMDRYVEVFDAHGRRIFFELRQVLREDVTAGLFGAKRGKTCSR